MPNWMYWITLIKNFTYKSKSGLNSSSIATLNQNLSKSEQKLVGFGSQNQSDQGNNQLPLIKRPFLILILYNCIFLYAIGSTSVIKLLQ